MITFIFIAFLNCSSYREPVSCNFVSSPKQQFYYEGKLYEIPESGSIELIADGEDSCKSDPLFTKISSDKFGMWTMKLKDPCPYRLEQAILCNKDN